MEVPGCKDERSETLRKLLFTAEALERAGELQRSQVSHQDRLTFVGHLDVLGQACASCVQMAYMDLSLFLAAECASDRDNVIFTERLRHDCQAALMRLHCSPKMVQQRCDFPMYICIYMMPSLT